MRPHVTVTATSVHIKIPRGAWAVPTHESLKAIFAKRLGPKAILASNIWTAPEARVRHIIEHLEGTGLEVTIDWNAYPYPPRKDRK